MIFGSGSLAQLPDEVERLDLRRVLLLATPPQASEARRLAGSMCAKGNWAIENTAKKLTEIFDEHNSPGRSCPDPEAVRRREGQPVGLP
ncbi:hypothetical protein [Lichenifustis flavocetrariae]|uniref:Uncharacterized protein n=1 Tax=Lichenifustis flavocetrariae TaxID=2949735 RepID=A0AA41Z497_9HYPH|nr:hypothetical protein [Lichenifustis flavocetrariae]MCW6512731.1 hypothetical protein [Lichenifustis flavocetrariae]